MKKIALSFFAGLLALSIQVVHAQELTPMLNEKGTAYGYADENGTFVIRPVYDRAANFSDEGVALVQWKGKYGYIDRAGKYVVEPKYSWIDTKYDEYGLCKVAVGGSMDENTGQMKGSKWGFMDNSRQEVIPAIYDLIDPFDSLGVCRVNIGGSYNAKVKEFLGGKYGYINAQGKELTPVKYTLADKTFAENRAGVAVGSKQGYVDRSGREITPIKYKEIHPFCNGVAVVSSGKLKGAIDSTGREITPEKYAYIGKMIDGCALVSVSAGKNAYTYGYIDVKGTEVVEPTYKWARENFNEGRSAVNNGSKWAVIDNSGKMLTAFEYDWVDLCTNGFIPVNKGGRKNASNAIDGGRWGFLDRDGKPVTEVEYAKMYYFTEQGLAMVYNGRCWGWIDGTGAVVIPLEYTSAVDFKDGLAPVKAPGKGIMWIDVHNNPVIETDYQHGSQFENGIALVQDNSGKYGAIDMQKNVLIPLIFTKEEIAEVRDDVFLKYNEGRKPVSERQATLYKLYKYRPQDKFKLVDVVPENLWDF